MSLERGILGFLDMKPMSGYDIKKMFEMSAKYFWPADQAQIYRSIKKLIDDGMVVFKEHVQGETVSKKIYAITEQGRKALRDWIIESEASDFISRQANIMKLFFSGGISYDDQLAMLSRQKKENRAVIEMLKKCREQKAREYLHLADMDEQDRRFITAKYTCEWGIKYCEVYEDLLDQMTQDLTRMKDSEAGQ